MKTAKEALVAAGIAAAGGSLIYQYNTGGCELCAVVGFGLDNDRQYVSTSAQPE